ncbi:MAG: MOSC domain-containing protein [Pseudomonadota bacterium]
MPALIDSGYRAKIIWLGVLADREAALRSSKTEHLEATYAGLSGDAHGGVTRPSCSRVVTQYPKGTDIRNVRQICIVSAEEMAAVAAEIGVEAFNPEWCGANMVIEGLPDFTHVPPSSRLQTESGTTLTVDMENQPCHLPAPVIDEDAPGHGRGFKAAAEGRRGVTAWVEREGLLRVGDTVSLHVPGQRAWSPEG